MATHITKRPDGREEITASMALDLRANPIDVKYLRAVTAASRARTLRPRKWYREIGELHFGVQRGAKIAGYGRIQARKIEKDGSPGDVLTTGFAADVAAMCSSPYGGQRGLIERYFTLSKVGGEAYAIRTREKTDGTGAMTGIDFVGAHELQRDSLDATTGIADDTSSGRPITPNQVIKRIVLPAVNAGTASGGEELYVPIQPEDFLGRLWRPTSDYVQLADSPMAALDTECEILHLLILGLKGKLMSRLALNGILYWPSQITQIMQVQPTGKENEAHDNPVLTRLIQAASWAIQNYDDPRSALPIFASGPAEYADAIKHIILDREVYQTDMDLRAEMLDKILTSMDINKQQTKQDGNESHWGAWMSSDDEIRVSIKPDLETMSWGLTRLVLNRMAVEQNVTKRTAEKAMLWFDLSEANTNVNLAEDARQAGDRILLGPEAQRRAMGFDEKDAPTPVEYIRGLGRLLRDPYLATFGMDEQTTFDWEKIAATKPTGPSADSPADDTESGPGKGTGRRGKSESDTPKRLKPAS